MGTCVSIVRPSFALSLSQNSLILLPSVATVRQELEAEIQHSKSIQAKLKTAPAASAPGSSLSLAHQKLQEDFDELKVRADLVEDLTGFSVITSKRENGETTFNCILNDFHGRLGGASFLLSRSSFVRIAELLLCEQASTSSSPLSRTGRCATTPTSTQSATRLSLKSFPLSTPSS